MTYENIIGYKLALKYRVKVPNLVKHGWKNPHDAVTRVRVDIKIRELDKPEVMIYTRGEDTHPSVIIWGG